MTNRLTHRLGFASLGLALCPAAALAQFSVIGPTNIVAGDQPSGIAIADFNGDGHADLATSVDNPDRVVLMMGNGAGGFVAGGSIFLGASTSPQDLIAGDWNGNGSKDLAVALRDPAGSVAIYSNNGTGVFTLVQTVAVGDRPRGLSAADRDGDGDMDIACANRDDGSASVLTNAGGTFTAQTMAVGGETRGTAQADLDGDGDRDLIVTNHDAATVVIFRNDGASYAQVAALPLGFVVRPDGVTSADLDGDGDWDIATTTTNDAPAINQVSVFLNTGAFTFAGPAAYAVGDQNASSIVAVELNCDGRLDLAVTNSDSSSVGLLSNLGGGAFGPAQLVAVGTHPDEIAVGDIDHDGDNDIATANRDSNNVSVIVNDTCLRGDLDGSGTVDFVDLLALLSAWGTCSGCVADLDGNGSVGYSDLIILLNAWS